MTLHHQDAKHGTVEHGRHLWWRSIHAVLQLRWLCGRASASSSLVVTSRTLCQLSIPWIFLPISAYISPLVIWFTLDSFISVSSKWQHRQTLKKWEAEPTPEGGGTTGLDPVRSRLPPCGFPRWQDLPHLRMWALNAVILVVKIGGLLTWTSVFYLSPREYRVPTYRSLPPLEVSSSCICTRMEIRDPLA
jgi:hypothetical protein